ncbi:MAG: hypothetical protein KGL48_04680 [Sphingomonadales bacterium]|nr:hypothetical protein [Sphingomonadales bacterium]
MTLAQQIRRDLEFQRIHVDYGGNATIAYTEEIDLDSIDEDTYSIQQINISDQNSRNTIIICRGKFDSQNKLDLINFINFRSSAPFDEYMIFNQQDNFSVQQIISIEKIFSSQRFDDAAFNKDSESELTAIVTAQLEQLRMLALDFSKRQLAAERRLEEAYRKREDALQERISTEEAKLSARRVDLDNHIEEERASIEAWRREINDREPQHERRSLREALTGEIKNYLNSPSSRSIYHEYITNALYVVVGIFFVVISIYLTVSYSASNQNSQFITWSIVGKSLVAGIGGAAFLWAGLSGLKSTSRHASEYDREMRRYSFDMDRASWIVETILQMSTNESAQVPSEWLESVCRDLFKSLPGQVDETKSLDALAALLDVTARAKIGTSGIDFEIDRKQAKRLAAEH